MPTSPRSDAALLSVLVAAKVAVDARMESNPSEADEYLELAMVLGKRIASLRRWMPVEVSR